MTARVTVTGRRRPIPAGRGDGPAAGDVRPVMRVQARIALTTCGIVALAVVGLPLLFAWAPGLSRIRLAGFRLPWLILSALVPPVWVATARRHVRRAERAERLAAAVTRD